ncbi:MAG: hypothetical protein JWN38_85 [Candidatus Saccharibacteria bacterium]|nr:hypothetical protein [Candidatus Saccharibacteria bacterium]
MSELFLLLLSLLLVVLCGVFVAAEFSFLTVNRSTVDKMAAKGDRRAQGVAAALRSLSTQLSGAQVGITITNLAIGFLAEPALSKLLEGPLRALGWSWSETTLGSVSVILGVGIATTVTMVFGELVPKKLAIAKPLGTAKSVQTIHRVFSHFMRGPIALLNGSANGVVRWFGIEPQEELASARSADELASVVRRSADRGTLDVDTAKMLERSLAFGDLTALDVMTARIRVKTVRYDDPVSEVVALAQDTGFSRFPVVREGGLDEVMGIVHIKRAVAVPAEARETTTIEHIMQQPLIVPSSIELDPLLQSLRNSGLQMAIIIDEFGGADGIVTVEDLIEELVGEVYDEHDNARALIRRRASGGWFISGLLRPDEVGQELGIFLPEERDYETIGGLVIDRLAHLPRVGEAVTIAGLDRDGKRIGVELTIERMDGRRIDRLLIARTAEVPEEDEA